MACHIVVYTYTSDFLSQERRREGQFSSSPNASVDVKDFLDQFLFAAIQLALILAITQFLYCLDGLFCDCFHLSFPNYYSHSFMSLYISKVYNGFRLFPNFSCKISVCNHHHQGSHPNKTLATTTLQCSLLSLLLSMSLAYWCMIWTLQKFNISNIISNLIRNVRI